MSKKIYILLSILGFLWGVWGEYLISKFQILLFGWLPISVVSIFLTGIYAALINYFYFKNYR